MSDSWALFDRYPQGWWPIARSHELTDGPLSRHYFGEDFVVWRTETGDLGFAKAYCPHMGAHLGHSGSVQGSLLQCNFHGSQFDGKGHCVNASASSLHIYSVCERDNVIYAWLPEGTPTWEVPSAVELMGVEELELIDDEYDIQVPWITLVGNGCDRVHFDFVHNGRREVNLNNYTTARYPNQPYRFDVVSWTQDESLKISHHFFGPTLVVVEILVGQKYCIKHYGASIPLDAQRTHLLLRYCQQRNPSAQKLLVHMRQDILADFAVWSTMQFPPRRPRYQVGDEALHALHDWLEALP